MSSSAFIRLAVWLSLLLALVVPRSWASPPDTGWLTDQQHTAVKVRLAFAGEYNANTNSLPAVLSVELEDDWKTYWRAPGEGGIAPAIDLGKSHGITRIDWHWPVPNEYFIQGIRTAGYTQQVNFPLQFMLEPKQERISLDAIFTLSSCTNVCVLTDFPIDLDISLSDLSADEDRVFEFSKAMSQVPQALPGTEITAATYDAQQQQLSISLRKATPWQQPQLFMHSDDAALDEVVYKLDEQWLSENDRVLTAVFTTEHWLELPDLNGHEVTLTVRDRDYASAHSTVIEAGVVAALPALELSPLALTTALFAALLGGLILNIMPCVLPVLGIKIHSLMSGNGLPLGQVRRHFFATAIGVVTTFVALGLVLVTLKLSGVSISWGMQFQNPWFIAALVLLTLLFALNLFGLFEVRLPSTVNQWAAQETKQSPLGHFLQGVLATILATPCTAPFLGTAVAFAFGAPPLILLLIFFALGLGMALPWLLIALFPRSTRFLPKPGRWLGWVKPILGIFMLATTLWLLSLLLPADAGASAAREERPWQELSFAQIQEHLSADKVVFVDVTADWCITCQANKYNVLLQDPVYSALNADDVVRMRGDWTRNNAYIQQFLQAYGQYGVPYNRVYGPARPEGIELPIILSDEAVMQAITAARGQ